MELADLGEEAEKAAVGVDIAGLSFQPARKTVRTKVQGCSCGSVLNVRLRLASPHHLENVLVAHVVIRQIHRHLHVFRSAGVNHEGVSTAVVGCLQVGKNRRQYGKQSCGEVGRRPVACSVIGSGNELDDALGEQSIDLPLPLCLEPSRDSSAQPPNYRDDHTERDIGHARWPCPKAVEGVLSSLVAHPPEGFKNCLGDLLFITATASRHMCDGNCADFGVLLQIRFGSNCQRLPPPPMRNEPSA